MGRAARIALVADQVVELRRAAAEIVQPVQRRRVEQVAARLRAELGESIPKVRAAALLGVSVTALEKWIARDMLPIVSRARDEIDADALLDVAEEVRRLRDSGRRHALLAHAFARLDEKRRSVASILEAAELIEAVSVVAASRTKS